MHKQVWHFVLPSLLRSQFGAASHSPPHIVPSRLAQGGPNGNCPWTWLGAFSVASLLLMPPRSGADLTPVQLSTHSLHRAGW